MQHFLGHAAEQELGDTGPAVSTDNNEIRRDLLPSRENDVRGMGFIELQQPVRLPSPSSPIPRRHDRSKPPSSDVRRLEAFELTKTAARPKERACGDRPFPSRGNGPVGVGPWEWD